MTEDRYKRIVRRIGLRVRTGRVFKGLTEEGLAIRAGFPRRRVARIEAGNGPRAMADELVAIARALDLPLWFFFEAPLGGEVPPVCPVCDRAWPE